MEVPDEIMLDPIHPKRRARRTGQDVRGSNWGMVPPPSELVPLRSPNTIIGSQWLFAGIRN